MDDLRGTAKKVIFEWGRELGKGLAIKQQELFDARKKLFVATKLEGGGNKALVLMATKIITFLRLS